MVNYCTHYVYMYVGVKYWAQPPLYVMYYAGYGPSINGNNEPMQDENEGKQYILYVVKCNLVSCN